MTTMVKKKSITAGHVVCFLQGWHCLWPASGVVQEGDGIRMPDQRSVGRSSHQAWKKKKDFAQKKVLEVHTTQCQWAHKSLVDQCRALKQLVYSLFYQKKIHSSAFVLFMWTQIQFLLHSASRMCMKQMSMLHCKPCIIDKTCKCSSQHPLGVVSY